LELFTGLNHIGRRRLLLIASQEQIIAFPRQINEFGIYRSTHCRHASQPSLKLVLLAKHLHHFASTIGHALEVEGQTEVLSRGFPEITNLIEVDPSENHALHRLEIGWIDHFDGFTGFLTEKIESFKLIDRNIGFDTSSVSDLQTTYADSGINLLSRHGLPAALKGFSCGLASWPTFWLIGFHSFSRICGGI